MPAIRKTIICAAAVLCCTLAAAQKHDIPYSVAHRGAHIDGLIPENSPAGVAMAARYGFRAIECDIHYTRDSVLIAMHDRRINRTMRTAGDYARIESDTYYSDLDYDYLRSHFVLESSDPALRTPITSFDELLAACKEYGVIPMLHSPEVEAYRRACEVLGSNGFIAFEENYDSLCKARGISRDCLILWDPGRTPADEVVRKLQAIGGPCGVSSMKRDLLTPEYIATIKAAGYEVQSSIFPRPHDITAVDNGCTIILSDFSLFPAPDSPVRRHPGTKRIRRRHMAAGDSVEMSWPHCEAGSIELSFEGSGDFMVTVCGMEYPVSGEGFDKLLGRRFWDEAPVVKVTALGDSDITRLKVSSFVY